MLFSSPFCYQNAPETLPWSLWGLPFGLLRASLPALGASWERSWGLLEPLWVAFLGEKSRFVSPWCPKGAPSAPKPPQETKNSVFLTIFASILAPFHPKKSKNTFLFRLLPTPQFAHQVCTPQSQTLRHNRPSQQNGRDGAPALRLNPSRPLRSTRTC